MTVLRRESAAGFDLGQLGRILGTALMIAIIAAGVVLAVTNGGSPQTSSVAQIEQSRAATMVVEYQNDWYAQANALNTADLGPASESSPFLSDTGTPTHRGRFSPGPATSVKTDESGDKADQLFYQQAGELTDPADLKFKN